MSAVNKITDQIKKMKAEDWKSIIKLGLSFIPGKIWKLASPKMWVVSEYESLARDNGYWFFKYLREKHKDRKVYYPIDFSSADYKLIKKLGNVIPFGGWKHYLLFWAADVYIGTTKCYGFPYRRICEDLVQWKLTSFKYVFLNHGFTRGYSSIVDAKETNYQLLFTCSEKDADIIRKDNGQSPKIMRCPGYPRHDTLNDDILNKKQILIMPTWRKWIDYRLLTTDEQKKENMQKFFASKYYNCLKGLVNNKEFISFLDKNDLNVVFYFHEYAQKYSKYIKSSSPRIKVGMTSEYSIQDLLRESALLITDYSSVVYDFAYMYKPVMYYQFDVEEFEKYQYAPGESFSYDEDGFGEVFFDEDKLVEAVKTSYEGGFTMDEKYRKRVDEFFAHHDNGNCDRVYKEIIKIARK